MLKKWKLLCLFVVIATVLVACNEEENETSSALEEEVQEAHTLTLEEARQTTEDLYTEIMNSMTAYVEQHELDAGMATEQQIDEMVGNLTPFATAEMMNGELRQIAALHCSGCEPYMYVYLMNVASFVRGEVEQVSATKLKMTNYSHPDYVFGGLPLKHETTLVYVDEQWKLANDTREETVLNLTEEEALIVANNYLFENPRVAGVEVNEAGTTIYVIESDTGIVRIDASTGSESYSPEVETQPIVMEEPEVNPYVAPVGKVVDLQQAFDEAMATVEAIYATSDNYELATQLDGEVMVVWEKYIADAIETVKVTMPNKAGEVEASYEEYLAGYDDAVYELSGGSGTYNSLLSSSIVQVRQQFAEELLQTYR